MLAVAGYSPAVTAVVADIFPPDQRGMACGICNIPLVRHAHACTAGWGACGSGQGGVLHGKCWWSGGLTAAHLLFTMDYSVIHGFRRTILLHAL